MTKREIRFHFRTLFFLQDYLWKLVHETTVKKNMRRNKKKLQFSAFIVMLSQSAFREKEMIQT